MYRKDFPMLNFDRAFSKNEDDLKPGTLLLSEPFMDDPNFKRAVIVLCSHSVEEGSFGFVINQPVSVKLHDVLEDFPNVETRVYYGGPVQQDTLHYLHTLGELIEGSKKIAEGVYWGGDFDQIKQFLADNPDRSKEIKFFLGYSGWNESQLSEELKTNSWIVLKGSHDLIWNVHHTDDWQKILEKQGGIFKQIANFPANPQLN